MCSCPPWSRHGASTRPRRQCCVLARVPAARANYQLTGTSCGCPWLSSPGAAEHTIQPRPQWARVGVSVLPEDDRIMQKYNFYVGFHQRTWGEDSNHHKMHEFYPFAKISNNGLFLWVFSSGRGGEDSKHHNMTVAPPCRNAQAMCHEVDASSAIETAPAGCRAAVDGKSTPVNSLPQ